MILGLQPNKGKILERRDSETVELKGTPDEVDIIVTALKILCGDLFQRRAVRIDGAAVDPLRVAELLYQVEQPNYVENQILPPSGTWPE